MTDIQESPRHAVRGVHTVTPIALLMDGEYLACAMGYRRMTAAPDVGVCLLESLLPSIRAFATLLAARRWQAQTPRAAAQLTDAADWMAARVMMLDLAHIEVDEAGATVLATAHARLAALEQELGWRLPRAMPLLHSGHPASSGWLHACSRHVWPRGGRSVADMLHASRQAAQQCGNQWQALLSLML